MKKTVAYPSSLPFSQPKGEEEECLLSSLYLAPVQYYSKLYRATKATIEQHEHYQKQSYRNRCVIAGANGTMPLSIPIEKPDNPKCVVKDIRIAEHGNWRHLHWNALISAYNSTPFFEYYEDDFRTFYEKKYDFLYDFNESLRETVCRLLHIDTPVEHTADYVSEVPESVADFREMIHPKRDWRTTDTSFIPQPYYQVFREKHGFLENLSIVDLLFNMGNEARLWL